MNSVQSPPRERDSGSFSTESAFETDLALKEARRWIEEVTEEKFRSNRFKASLQDGVLLCRLVNKLRPGIVKKINTIRTTMCYMENVSFFLNACKELGLKGSQLFDVSDLQDVPRRKEAKGGSIRGDYERTLRNVCITIYWLGRAANRISGYKGPQLDENKFMELIGPHTLAGESDRPVHGFHTIGREDYDDATLDRESLTAILKKEPGAVSENGSVPVQRSHADEKSPPPHESEKPTAATADREEILLKPKPSPKLRSVEKKVKTAIGEDAASKRASDVFRDTAISVDMLPGENKFGFSVVGGKDEGFQVKVDSVQPGTPAERAGLKSGDLVLWVNGQTVLNADHRQVVSLIMECVLQRSITLGVRRTVPRPGSTIEDAPVPVSTPKTSTPTKPKSSEGAMSPTTRKPDPIKKRYKTSRALEVHFQTKKRTRTEVTCHEEEEEQPASLQSGRSRRIVYVTRAELVRHFETSTRPKKEIAWLIIYAGGLFAPVPVHVTATTVQRQRAEVAEVLPGSVSGGAVVVERAARPSSQVIDQNAPVVVEMTAPVAVTDVVAKKEVPLESFVPDEKKRRRLSSDEISGAKREAREEGPSSPPSDDDVSLAKKAGKKTDVPVEVGKSGTEEVISATRHGEVRVDWGSGVGDGDEKMDYDDYEERARHVDDDDDDVVVRGMVLSEAQNVNLDFNSRGMAPVDETLDSVMQETVVESTMDWDDFERLGERGDGGGTVASASQPARHHNHSAFISEGEFEELNTTIVNVHERSTLKVHWKTQLVDGGSGETVITQRPAPVLAPQAQAVLVGSAAVTETAELTQTKPRSQLEGNESWMSEEGGASFAVSGEGESEEFEAAAPALRFKTDLNEAKPAVATVMSPVSRTIVDVSESAPKPKPRVKLEGDEAWDNDEGESSFAVTGETDTGEYEADGRRQRVPDTESVPLRRLDDLKAPDDDKQRYSLTEEEKLRSKQEIENIWALAENRDGRSNSPSPEKKEAAAVAKVAEVVETENAPVVSPVVRPAQRFVSNSSQWDDESQESGGKFKRFEGVEPLLASLAHIKSKYNTQETEKLDFSFLEDYIARPEFSNAMRVHNRVIEVSNENGPKPVVNHARFLLEDTKKAMAEDGTTEADELAAILVNPYFQGACYAHDRIAERDFAPPTPVLEGLATMSPVPVNESAGMVITPLVKSAPDDEALSPIEEKGPMKFVRIEREGTDPIGLTVRRDDDNGRIFVSRILRNSKADRKRELQEGDEILQINRKPVRGKTIDDVAHIMKAAPGPVDLGLKPTDDTDGHPDQTEIFVKAHFTYNPTGDPYLPCDELGLAFKTGDILHIFNQSDSLWWQAALADDTTREFAALIPGKELQEKKDAAFPKVLADDDDELSRRKKKKKGSCVPKKSKKRRHLYRPGDGVVGYVDDDQVAPYEQVIKINPDPRFRRPIVLIGPDGIGCRSIVQHLISLDGQKFASVLPETSRAIRPGEKDGDLYRFVSREQMERDFKENLYIEYGELNGNYYGTRFSSIKSVVDSGRVCLLSLHQKALKILKHSDLRPYVIFVRPGDRGPTPSSPSHINGHSNGTSDDTLKIQQNEARYIEDRFAAYFDQTIVLSSVAAGAKEILSTVDRLASQPQWIYAAWDQRR